MERILHLIAIIVKLVFIRSLGCRSINRIEEIEDYAKSKNTSNYHKMENGQLCSTKYPPITSEDDCKKAAKELKLKYGESFTGPTDFPGCLYAQDGRDLVYFNLSPDADNSMMNKNYAALCKTGNSSGMNDTSYCTGSYKEPASQSGNGKKRPPPGTPCVPHKGKICQNQKGRWGSSFCKVAGGNWGAECIKCSGAVKHVKQVEDTIKAGDTTMAEDTTKAGDTTMAEDTTKAEIPDSEVFPPSDLKAAYQRELEDDGAVRDESGECQIFCIGGMHSLLHHVNPAAPGYDGDKDGHEGIYGKPTFAPTEKPTPAPARKFHRIFKDVN